MEVFNMLSPKAITEFKAIYKKEFDTELSEQEAQEQGMKLLRFFKLIYQPIPKKWLKQKINTVDKSNH